MNSCGMLEGPTIQHCPRRTLTRIAVQFVFYERVQIFAPDGYIIEQEFELVKRRGANI